MELGKGLIERAARFDGVVPFPADGTYAKPTPEKIHQLKRLLDQQRTDSKPFDSPKTGDFWSCSSLLPCFGAASHIYCLSEIGRKEQ
jgi:hypothetical protein